MKRDLWRCAVWCVGAFVGAVLAIPLGVLGVVAVSSVVGRRP